MSDAPLASAAEAHARTTTVEIGGVPVTWKAGCRGHPQPPPGWAALVKAARDLSGEVLDASGLLAAPGRAAAAGGARVRVLEPSAAGLAAAARAPEARNGSLRVSAGLPWDAPAGSFDHVLLAPPAERGSARVRAELTAAARALRPGGRLWLLLEKDRGAKRYEKDAARILGDLAVVDRHKGWRLSRAIASDGALGAEEEALWLRFDTPRGAAWALPGAFAAGKLDPGTALLLESLDEAGVDPAGDAVLDLGCGWGAIARWAQERGATVTAIDDDLAAVRSTRRNVPDAEVLHADLDADLDAGLDAGRERARSFGRVLVNPPFHLGAGVRMALPAAFLAAAARRVRRGGEIWLVANAALPYGERLAAAGFAVDEVRAERGFRIWRASPRKRR